MENQNIQWEIGKNNLKKIEQPQVNWGEQPQQENIPTWGESTT
jgi:hypothetical protein